MARLYWKTSRGISAGRDGVHTVSTHKPAAENLSDGGASVHATACAPARQIFRPLPVLPVWNGTKVSSAQKNALAGQIDHSRG